MAYECQKRLQLAGLQSSRSCAICGLGPCQRQEVYGAKPCGCHADDGCIECDIGMLRLSDDIDITQSIELLTGATLDLETGERQFAGTYSHLVIEDCDRIAALLKRLRGRLQNEDVANG